MNARYLIFGSLGAMLLLVGALLLIGGDPEGDAGVPLTTTDTTAAGGAVDSIPEDSLSVDSLSVGVEVAGPGDGGPGDGGSRSPAAGGGTGGSGGAVPDGDTPVSSDGTTGPRPSGSGQTGGTAGGSPGTGGGVSGGNGTGGEASSADLNEILRRLAARYEGVNALQADFRQVIDNPLLGRRTESAGTLYQRQPDLFLMRFSDPEGDVIVSDGDYFWVYYPSVDARQVIRSDRGAEGLDLRSQFVGDPTRRFEAEHHGREDVRGRTTHVVTLVPREAVGYRRLKVWIDAEDHLVRRFELTEENSNVRRFELTDLRVNPDLARSLFTFEPPAGAHVVRR